MRGVIGYAIKSLAALSMLGIFIVLSSKFDLEDQRNETKLIVLLALFLGTLALTRLGNSLAAKALGKEQEQPDR